MNGLFVHADKIMENPMAIEIERRFFVNDKFNQLDLSTYESSFFSQGYIAQTSRAILRVRITTETAFITIKSQIENATLGHHEFEYEIPQADAKELIELSQKSIVTKKRCYIPTGDLLWEVDVFEGDNKGLIIAEIELPSEDTEIELPEWLGEEITDNSTLSNYALSINPWTTRFY